MKFFPLSKQSAMFNMAVLSMLVQLSFCTNAAAQAIDQTTDILNSAASVSGDAYNVFASSNNAIFINGNTGSVTEDNVSAGSVLISSGKLIVINSDASETTFIVSSVIGKYGRLVIDASGNWQYSSNNDQDAIQALGSGSTLTENLTVYSISNIPYNISIIIYGADDAAVISGDNTGSVTEDSPFTGNQLVATGKLKIIDRDNGESALVASSTTGSYGRLVIRASGYWYYSANNKQRPVQMLTNGAVLKDRLTVVSAGGETYSIDITINGVNDMAVISGDDTGSVTKDNVSSGSIELSTTGILTISDIDRNEAAFKVQAISGLYGTLFIDAIGNWRYSANNNQADIQALINDDTLVENLAVSSVDGTMHPVVITINSLDIGVKWTAPLAREDGSPISLSQIAGYRIYYGSSSGDYVNMRDIKNAAVIKYLFTDIPAGQAYYLVMTCYDAAGRESLYSSEVVIRNRSIVKQWY